MQLDEQRLRFRDAMASLSAAVNIITTEGDAGQCGITATAVCSVTDTPPSLMVCINANSAMNPVFQGNGKLCVNVLNHEQELMARHFAGGSFFTCQHRGETQFNTITVGVGAVQLADVFIVFHPLPAFVISP